MNRIFFFKLVVHVVWAQLLADVRIFKQKLSDCKPTHIRSKIKLTFHYNKNSETEKKLTM